MRAAVFEAARSIRVQQIDRSAAPASGITIDVSACGICGSDLHTYASGVLIEPGQVMGHEFSGVVAEVGAEVIGIRIGDRVTALPLDACGTCPSCRRDEPSLCHHAGQRQLGYGLAGAMADTVVVDNVRVGRNVFLLPDTVGDIAAATIEPCAVAVHVMHRAPAPPSGTVLVFGLGMIGLMSVQAYRAAGAGSIIAVDPSERRRSLAVTGGATAVFAPGDEVRAAIAAATTGDGADVVVETSGVDTALESALRLSRIGGTVVMPAQTLEPLALDAALLVNKELSLLGSFAFRSVDFARALAWVAQGRLTPEAFVTHSFDLDALDEAFQIALDREASGKVMLTMTR